MKVSIIIPNRNNVALLGITLRSVFEDVSDADFKYEIIVADNSNEDIYEHIRTRLITPKFSHRFIHQEIPCLFYAFDEAVNAAKGKYIIRLDSDMICGKNMIKDMVKFADVHPGIGFGHAPVNFFSQTPAAMQHKVSLIPGNKMCRWDGYCESDSKMTYKGMPWICDRSWYINELGGYGALTQHLLAPFGDPYLGIKSLMLGYDSWAIACRPGIHMGRMESSKPFDKFRANSDVGNYNSYMTACVTAEILTDDPERWAPIFIRVGQVNEEIEKKVVEYYRENVELIEDISSDDKARMMERAKYSFEELITQKPWERNGNMKVKEPTNHYDRCFPVWKSVAGKRAASCIKQEDWQVLRGLTRKYKVKEVLEFGSGMSTILFDRLGIKVLSYETDLDFMQAMRSVCSDRVEFKLWDNKSVVSLKNKVDMALVDGIRPRFKQAENAKNNSDVVVVHDIGASSKGVPERVLSDWRRVENNTKRTGVYVRPAALESPMVSVIISHRNDFPMLGITIRSVLEDCVDLDNFVEVVVCDNSVKDRKNINYVIAHDLLDSGQVRVVYQDYPCLFTARELAIDAAGGKYLVMLDSHMVIGRNMVRDMVDYMETEAPKNIGFAHAPLMYVNQNESAKRHEFQTRRYFDKPHKMGIKGMPWICRKEFWEGTGGYGSLAANRMSWGGGDVYLALKPWVLGYENWAIPCRPGLHIGPYSKLDRKYYVYRMWGKSGETPSWYGLLAAAYVLGEDEINNPVTRLREYHVKTLFDDPVHWERIKEMCAEERVWMDEHKKFSIKEILNNKPWE